MPPTSVSVVPWRKPTRRQDPSCRELENGPSVSIQYGAMRTACCLFPLRQETFEWLLSEASDLIVEIMHIQALQAGAHARIRSMPGLSAEIHEAMEDVAESDASIRRLLADEAGAPEELAAGFGRELLDLGRDWQNLEQVLRRLDTDRGSCCVSALNGGQEIGSPMDDGVLRFLDSPQVRPVAADLAAAQRAEFRAAADRALAGEQAELLPARLDSLWDVFEKLRQFFARASSAGLYIAIAIG